MKSPFKKIAVSSASFATKDSLMSEARKLCSDVEAIHQKERWNEEDFVQRLNKSGADALILGTEPMTRSVINKLTHLKAIGKYGVGCDNVDLETLKDKGIHFGWQGGVNRRSVTELALGFMLGHFRNISKSMDRMQRSVWQKEGGMQLSNRTVGIIGLGFIGSDLSKILKALGCEVLYYDIVDKPREAKDLGVIFCDYPEILRRSDVVSFHIPGGVKNQNFLNRKNIDYLQPHALIVNTSRGDVVDFEAVVEAVLAKRLAGFASDVFPKEPLHDTRFRIEDGFYFTPHIGGNAAEAVTAMGEAALNGLKSYSQR